MRCWLFWFLLVYLVRERRDLGAARAGWPAVSGGGAPSERFRRAHVLLIGWYLRGLVGSAARVLGLTLVSESVPDDLALGRAPTVPRPVRSSC